MRGHLCGATLRKLASPTAIPRATLLQAHNYQIDYDHWHAFVHGTLDYDGLLKRDPRLRQCLLSMQLPRHIFTNADHNHVDRCLDNLGIADCFEVRRHAIAFCHLCQSGIASGSP